VEIGPADPARRDVDEDLARPGRAGVDLGWPQRLAGAVEQHRAHQGLPSVALTGNLPPDPPAPLDFHQLNSGGAGRGWLHSDTLRKEAA
jgi:hypothetical protein